MANHQPMGDGVLATEERHPLLTATGRRALDDLLEAPGAPRWNHRCGDRLDARARAAVEAFATLVAGDPPRWEPDRPPGWLAPVLERAAATPRYRRSTIGIGAPFTTGRDDLRRAWWELVPDDADLDDLIWFPTSGTGGPPATVPTHPVTVSCYYPLLLEAARWHGVEDLGFRDDHADWLTVFDQRQGGFCVPSWSSVLGCATAKVNLDPVGWQRDRDRERFLERHDPRVITGDPVSLATLADLAVDLHPRLVVSTAMHLTAATRQRLEERFGCPAIDVYSTTESGPIAATRPAGGMGLLQPRLLVEVVDDDGLPAAPGERGAIALTGGMNPYLPLVRYRTGDHGRLTWEGGQPVLLDLAAREPLVLRSASGAPVGSIDVTIVLEPLPLRRWSVHQRADGSVAVRIEAEAGAPPDLDHRVVDAVHVALGPVAVDVEPLRATDKVAPFTAEVPA